MKGRFSHAQLTIRSRAKPKSPLRDGLKLWLLAVIAACAGKLPDTRYYQLAAPTSQAARGDLVIALEPFETDSGYDDDRIVYRATPYRLDYYHYHRWSASPGVLVGNFFEQALERSGRFRAVVRDGSPLVVRGRVVAIEEVDQSKTRWLGRIVLELALVDTRTGATLWSQDFEETEPLRIQSPEGLAQALSIALGRIAATAAPAIADHADRQLQVRR
jgi:ABC-type uncharacterized transport system auxiliary subunit